MLLCKYNIKYPFLGGLEGVSCPISLPASIDKYKEIREYVSRQHYFWFDFNPIGMQSKKYCASLHTTDTSSLA